MTANAGPCADGARQRAPPTVPDLVARWPLAFVVDSHDRSVGWAVVHSRVVSPARQAQLADLRRAGFRFLGMTSDGSFPAGGDRDPIDYGALCEAWCHCFRDPDRYLPRDAPRALLSVSDFTDERRVSREASAGGGAIPDGFDFVYVCGTEPWKRAAKSWELARRCIPRIRSVLGLRALMVGARADDPPCADAILRPPLRWPEFLACLSHARFLFAPNVLDASPRVLGEALCLDVPVVVNRAILGGWKYVNAFTGVSFDGEDDVVDAVRECLRAARSPRAWFRANHGPYVAGFRLLRLLRLVDPSISERSHLRLSEAIDAPPARTP